MTSHQSSRRSRARAARSASVRQASLTPEILARETQVALIGRLRRMADEVESLQSEIAAVEAFVTEPTATATATIAEDPRRPGAGWTPTPTIAPWLAARSA